MEEKQANETQPLVSGTKKVLVPSKELESELTAQKAEQLNGQDEPSTENNIVTHDSFEGQSASTQSVETGRFHTESIYPTAKEHTLARIEDNNIKPASKHLPKTLIILLAIVVGGYLILHLLGHHNKNLIAQTVNTGNVNKTTVLYTPDQKRQSDISWLQTEVQAFYNTYGYYPSLADMNNPEFMASKMPGAASHLIDPGSTTQSHLLVSRPTKNQYSYQVTDKSGAICEANDQLCADYTLTAILSNGSELQKSNSN